MPALPRTMVRFEPEGVHATPIRGDRLFVSVVMVCEELEVVSKARVERDGPGDLPFVLCVEPDVRIRLRHRRCAERLRKAGVVVRAGKKIRERGKRVRAAVRPRICDRVVVEENVHAGAQRMRVRPDAKGCRRPDTSCSRDAVGLPDSVPNDATPAMLTAGPIGSVGGAFRSPYANCARVSLTVRAESASVLLIATALIDVVESRGRAWRVQRRPRRGSCRT